MKRIPFPVAVFVFLAAALIRPTDTHAQGISFIRDAEIENTIRAYAAPLFRAAGLDADSVDIFLVKDNSLNAFVAGGQKLFLNTGLLMRSETAGQVIGVIAHETGHIAGGHLSRVHTAMAKARAQSILSYVLGGLAALGTGRADVGGAIIAGGQQIGVRSFFRYTRTQESAADQAAMRLLDGTGQSTKGLLEFMNLLVHQEQLSAQLQDPYVQTHPITSDRIKALKAHAATSPFTNKPIDPAFEAAHRRTRAKLYAFMGSPDEALNRYKAGDKSLAARYARAIAFYRLPNLDKALTLIDGLLAEHPRDPYFHELKGQMLFENGHADRALASYENAVRLLPGSALLRRDLAHVQLELNDPALLEPAITHLRAALQRDSNAPYTWRQLAIAYGRKGNMGMSSLALAEEALLHGDLAIARHQAGRAEKLLPRGSPSWLQAQDILEAARKKS